MAGSDTAGVLGVVVASGSFYWQGRDSPVAAEQGVLSFDRMRTYSIYQ